MISQRPLPQELFVDFPLKIGCQRAELPRANLGDGTSGVFNQSINLTNETSTTVEDMTKNMVPTAMCMELENVPIVSTSVIVTESTASVVAMEMKHKMKRKLGITNSLEVEPKPSTSTSVEVFVYSHTRKRKSTVGENHLTGQKDEKLLQHLKTATDSLKILAKTSINVCYIRQIRVKLFE